MSLPYTLYTPNNPYTPFLMSDELSNQRDQIDQIDTQIIQLFSDRQQNVKKIGQIKEENSLPIYDAKRELEARTKRRKLAAQLDVDPLRLEVLFEQIVLLAKDTQQEQSDRKGLQVDDEKSLRVGIMGGIGSFSEQAALDYLKDQQVTNYELFYPISSENVLKELSKDSIDLAIFPIENSTAGLVRETIYAASQYTFDIQEIFDFDVRHCLHVLPGVKKEDIKKVMSHPQALKQCKGYLKSNFPNAELIDATDTAEGARILEQSPEEKTLAVIAPKRAGELYHLETLEEGIQDLEENYTRFIAAKKN
jgi:chorismate mutase/prephenate dehydratase